MQGHAAPTSRPLSPHLQIYRFTLLMASSIIHRITGGALYFGTLLLVAWLLALALGPQTYELFSRLLFNPLGLLVLFGYTWALLHHMMGGLRHLIWDTGASLSVPAAKRLTAMSWLVSILASLAVWAFAFLIR